MKDRIFQYCDRQGSEIVESMLSHFTMEQRATKESIKEAFDCLPFFTKLRLVSLFFKLIPFAVVAGGIAILQ